MTTYHLETKDGEIQNFQFFADVVNAFFHEYGCYPGQPKERKVLDCKEYTHYLLYY